MAAEDAEPSMADECDVLVLNYIKDCIEHDGIYEWYGRPEVGEMSGDSYDCVFRAARAFEKRYRDQLDHFMQPLIQGRRLDIWTFKQIADDFLELFRTKGGNRGPSFPLLTILAFCGYFARRLEELVAEDPQKTSFYRTQITEVANHCPAIIQHIVRSRPGYSLHAFRDEIRMHFAAEEVSVVRKALPIAIFAFTTVSIIHFFKFDVLMSAF